MDYVPSPMWPPVLLRVANTLADAVPRAHKPVLGGGFSRHRASFAEVLNNSTASDNEAALGLYRRLGGQEITFVGFGWDGAFDDE